MLSVIIIHYGNPEKTIDCISSVMEKIKVPYEIIVWDNDEGNSKLITQNLKFIVQRMQVKGWDLKIVRIGKNIGYGAAINRAVKFAKYEYILILNNDTQLLSDIKAETINSGVNCIYGAQTYDENMKIPSCYLDLNPFDEFSKNLRIRAIVDNVKKYFNLSVGGQFSIINYQFSTLHWTYNVGGHFLLLQKKLFEKIGGFDEKYFMYAEEFDLCKKARLTGYKIIFNPNLKVCHKKNYKSPSNITAIRIDSKLFYLKKFYPALFIFTLLANCLVSLIYIILIYICKNIYKDYNLIELKRYNELLFIKTVQSILGHKN